MSPEFQGWAASITGLSFLFGGYHRLGNCAARGQGGYAVYNDRHWALDGTDLAGALSRAFAAQSTDPGRDRNVVLLTDGDSNEGAISPEYSAHLAQKEGVRVYTVQIGNGDDVDVQRFGRQWRRPEQGGADHRYGGRY